MSRSAPYQPLLLKILHGVSGILAIAAMITGFLVYNSFDGRFGKILIPRIEGIIDIHGTFAVFSLFFSRCLPSIVFMLVTKGYCKKIHCQI